MKEKLLVIAGLIVFYVVIYFEIILYKYIFNCDWEIGFIEYLKGMLFITVSTLIIIVLISFFQVLYGYYKKMV